MQAFKKIAVLIDAENTQLDFINTILEDISTKGRIIVKKAYGDWKNQTLKNWEKKMSQLAIKPEQKFAYTKGKNAVDIAMVIGAMELLYTKLYDAFVLVSSDSDYTPLAIKLRESGAYVFGIGENKTASSFKNACDSFILYDHLNIKKENPIKSPVKPNSAKNEADDKNNSKEIEHIHKLFRTAFEEYQDDDGWTNAGEACQYIMRVKPDFNYKSFGYTKFTKMLEAYPVKYNVKRFSGGDNKATIAKFQCK